MWMDIDLQWFSAEDEGRTEEPTEHLLEEARKEGRIAKSRQLISAISFLSVVVSLIFLGKWIFFKCQELFVFYFTRTGTPEDSNGFLASGIFKYFLPMVVPIAFVGAVFSIIANIVQNKGFLFSTKPIEPDLKKIIPNFAAFFKRGLFSFSGVWNIASSVAKIAVIVLVVFMILKKDLPAVLGFLSVSSIRLAVGKIASMTVRLLIICSIIFVAFSIPDYIIQKREFMESMKITKQMVKQEYKEMEGDPEVKHRLEEAQRALLMQQLPKKVAESDVVITNPTHYAVALLYQEIHGVNPIVNIKGEGIEAQKIKKIAKNNNIPIVENKPVAQELYKNVKIGQEIPEFFITAIATIYSSINYKRKNRF